MSAFKELKEASNDFEEDLKSLSGSLFTVKICETFEDSIARKMQDLSLFTSKLRLLQAKHLALSPEIAEQERDASNTIDNYGDTVVWKIIEQQAVKSFTQTHAVRSLITASDTSLEPELLQRKKKIIDQLKEYRQKDIMLHDVDKSLSEKEKELALVREEWDKELGELRNIKSKAEMEEEKDLSGPLYDKLRIIVNKMEIIRWLISQLIVARTGDKYDWLADPQRRFDALKLAREHNTIDKFLESSS